MLNIFQDQKNEQNQLNDITFCQRCWGGSGFTMSRTFLGIPVCSCATFCAMVCLAGATLTESESGLKKINKVVIPFEPIRSWIGMIWHMANPICSRFPLPRTGCWYHEESVIYEWGSYWWPQSLSKVWLKIIYVNHRQRYNCFKQWHNHSNQSLSWGDEILEDELDRRAATPQHGGAILPPSCASCAFTHLEMCCNLTDLQQSSFVHVKSWHCCRFGLQLLFRGVEQMPKSRPKRLNPARLALLKAGPFVTPVCEIQQVQMSAASRIPIFSNSNSTTIGKAETKKQI